MLSEQLAPSTALHLDCNSVAGSLKAKDGNCYISQTDCDDIKAVQQQQLHDSNISMTQQLSITTAPPITTATTNTSSTTATNLIGTTIATVAATTTTIPIATTATTNISPATRSLRKSSIAPPAARQKPTNDASGRSAALERAYVHDVYENCEEPTGPIRPRVAQFLGNMDPGSVVCDVGCGSGRYLTQCNPLICTVGVDRCYRLSKVAHEKGGEVTLCDNLELPFRDESFDAVLSLAVVHHFATTERRVVALRELARILRIGGRVIITVWALEQRHRRFESQDVLIPWQPPKNRNFNYSDEEDDEDFLPPYHAYTEDSTNSSRSAGDGDSSSLSSSSPGESCYSFVRRAIQKLAGGRKHPWFLDSWTSKDTKNDSSLDYEDAKDLPIELRRLEDFEDFPDPPLSAGLKSRSLGSILNPPPRQIVRSRSSVPSLGGPLLQVDGTAHKQQTQAQFLSLNDGASIVQSSHSPTNNSSCLGGPNTCSSLGRRPKLIKQKQSLCDEDYQLPENPFHMISSYNSCNNSVNNSIYTKSGCYGSSSSIGNQHHHPPPTLKARQMAQASLFLRKQSSLNEELMAGNRIREKERVRKRIQKQMSLNEAFLCRSALFSKRLQVIREGFTTKIKTSTGSLERVTKNGLSKIMQNFKTGQNHATTAAEATNGTGQSNAQASMTQTHCQHHQQQQQQHHCHHHNHHHHAQNHLPQILHKPISLGGIIASKFNGPVTYCSGTDCASSACYCSTYQTNFSNNPACGNCCNNCINEDQQNKPRRHSRESGSDSSKDSSLQSDTSIESEDSFASVIFIPKPEQHQQQLNYQQQHQNSNSSSSNSSSSNGGQCCQNKGGSSNKCNQAHQCKTANCSSQFGGQQQQYRVPSVPTSPLIMPCPPTPAHSPAATQNTVTSPPQIMAAVTAAMAILTPPTLPAAEACNNENNSTMDNKVDNWNSKNRFNFDEADIQKQKQQEKEKVVDKQQQQQQQQPVAAHNKQFTPKITRQTIKDLPPIPKFRKQQSLQLQRQSFPIVRRSSATAGAIPSAPKLLSLELFNPATDDLDSDSSEPSSPDSVDSVISAPKSATLSFSTEDTKAEVVTSRDLEESIKLKQQQYHNGELKINPATPNDIILNDESSTKPPVHCNGGNTTSNGQSKQHDCVEFAEKLSAQLQRELDDKVNRTECRSLDGIGDISDFLDDTLACQKKRNSEARDLTAFREELRERRLMLANLSTQPSLQQSPTSSSTSSLSSQTRSFTIHEEDEEEDAEEENERSYTLQLYENCKISKFNYKRNRHYNLNPETAYLLQDDGDSSIRDDDDIDDIEHDVILEEDEEAAAAEDLEADGGDEMGETIHEYGRKNSRNTIKCDSLEDNSPGGCVNQFAQKVCATNTAVGSNQPQQLQNQRQSTESWEHSNSSTTSLDSPSQGGATTHHRYYHVFREGELDALINHHVASLHIVSSYYERASWCVIAEKVQMWTI